MDASCTIAGRSVIGPEPQLAQLAAQRREPLRVLVQDRRQQRRLRDAERVGHVLRVPGAAGSDHRQIDRLGDGRGELEVVAGSRSVGVDRRQQDLAGTAHLGLAGPVDGPAPGLGRAGPRADLPSLGVDRDDDRLRAQSTGELGHELRPLERGRVDSDLVGAGREQLLAVACAAHAAADRERDRQPLRDLAHERDERCAFLERRLHVEEDELVGARVGVRRPELDRVADLAQALEAHALDDATAGDVEARDQARERDRASSR